MVGSRARKTWEETHHYMEKWRNEEVMEVVDHSSDEDYCPEGKKIEVFYQSF